MARNISFKDIEKKLDNGDIKVLKFSAGGTGVFDVSNRVIAVRDISDKYDTGTVGVVMNENYSDGLAEYMANHVFTSHGSVLFIEDIIGSVKLNGYHLLAKE